MTNLAVMDARVTRIEEDVKEIKSDIKALRDDMKSLRDDMARLFVEVSYLKGRIEMVPTTMQLGGFVIAIFVAAGLTHYFVR